MRAQLMWGILVPVLIFIVLTTVSLYRQTPPSADTAYDRSLLASAKAFGELLDVVTEHGQPRLKASLSYAALEAFEADNRSRGTA